MRIVMSIAAILALFALVAGPVLAQYQAPGTPPARPAPGAAAPAAPEDKTKEIEGTVKKVDPGTKSLQVSSGLLGLFGATMEVDDQTKINVEGKQATLSDIREGAKVKASYESREGKNLAKTIQVMPAEQEQSGSSPRPASPGATGPAPVPSPSGSSAPAASPAGQPKTP